MAIVTKQVKLPIIQELSCDYVEKHLDEGILRWAITKVDEEFYTIDCAVVEYK